MAIKSNLKMHPVSWLITQNKNGNLNKNISIQRKEVWDAEKKSNLIAAIILDVPLESLLFEDLGNRTYNVLDGKQRTLTLCAFAEDGFALSPKIRIKEINGIQLVGKNFSDLPEELKSQITEYQLSISMLNELQAEERSTVFFMRNQAVPLSKMDLTPVMLGEEAMQDLESLCRHKFITDKVRPTPAHLRKRDDLKMILQYLILCGEQEAGFSGTEIMSVCDDIKNGEIIIESDKITAILNYLDEAFPAKRAYLKNTHIPTIIFIAQKAMGINMKAAIFQDKLDKFFLNIKNNTEFTAACQQGSAKKSNVQMRLKIMSQILDTNDGADNNV